jgi:hypothetical protein
MGGGHQACLDSRRVDIKGELRVPTEAAAHHMIFMHSRPIEILLGLCETANDGRSQSKFGES